MNRKNGRMCAYTAKKCEIVDMGPTMISVLANHTSKSVRILSCVTFFFSVSDDEGLIVTELRPL